MMMMTEWARNSSKNFKYRELLAGETVDDLRKLAKAARIKLPPQMKRQQLIDYLSHSIPNALPELKKTLTAIELLLCEVVASAGGRLPVAEAKLRVEVEVRRRKAKKKEDSNQEKSHQYDMLGENKNKQLVESQIYSISDYRWGDRTPVDLFLFHRELYPDADDRFYGKTSCLLMPEGAMKYFERKPVRRPGLQEHSSSELEALRGPSFAEIIFALLDQISRSAASKKKNTKASPGLGRMPKNIMLPILQKYVASTEVFRKVVFTNFFEWYEANEIISDYAHFKGLVQNDGEDDRLRASTEQSVLDLLASERKLCSDFIEWWASTENFTSVIRPRLFALDGGAREGEAKARSILLKIIRNEMKPGRWYSIRSIIDRIRNDETGYHFDRIGIGRRGPMGTVMTDACTEICKTMIAFPLLLFGIIETNGPEMEYVRLGRWASETTEKANAGKHNRGVVVTPNFEVILQPEAKTFSFQLMEFCESTESEGPAIILRITKSSVLKAFRTLNYTLERIFTFIRDMGVELPENVAHELNEWGRRYGEAELRMAEIVECRDDAIAAALMTDPTMKRHIVRRVGSTTLEVRPDSESEILSRCDSLGLLARG